MYMEGINVQELISSRKQHLAVGNIYIPKLEKELIQKQNYHLGFE